MAAAMAPKTPVPRAVALVGRPNVGKSALFNRLVGRRLSIVHEESGVTRDRVTAEAEWQGDRFEVIDTGGLQPPARGAPTDLITAGIAQQVETAIADAAAILLVVDITAGLHALDHAVADRLRRTALPVWILANKADHEGVDTLGSEFTALGFPVQPVSALHNRGMDTVLSQVVPALPAQEPEESAVPLQVAVVGRPNVGKSSYINRLLRNERVIVSAVPGTTRDSIAIPFTVGHGPQARAYTLIDTAGMRRKGKIKDTVERFSLMRTEKSIARADVVLLLLDAQQGPTAMDKQIAARIVEQQRGIVLGVNKWDLARAGGVTQRAYTEALSTALPFLGFAPIVYFSAQSGYNIRRSIDVIDHVAAQVRTPLSTGLLNRVLQDACTQRPPPARAQRRFKLYYATQVGTQPIRIRCFVNAPRLLPDAYRQYLVRILRQTFGLEGAPIVLQLRGKPDPKPGRQ